MALTQNSPWSQIHWLRFRNDSGETAPAGAVMKVTGMDVEEAGQVFLTVTKPDTYGSQYNHVVNGRIKVKSGNRGICTFASDGTVPALFDETEALEPGYGELWGPLPSSWKLHQHVGGFQATGRVTDERVLVTQRPLLQMEGDLDDALSSSSSHGVAESTATLSIFHGKGSDWIDSTHNLTVTNRSDDYSAPADMRLGVAWVNGEWRPIARSVHPPIRGTLDTQLVDGGTATLSVTVWDGSTWGDEGTDKTVREVLGVASPIASGTVCWCEWHDSIEGYAVVSAACQ